jgi:hypothetical protein
MSETLFLVDAGAVRTPGGTPVTKSFRITANGPTAAQIAAMQVLAGTASRRRESFAEPWARVADPAG